MGDRANFGFKQGDNTIFLYGHWAGQEMINQFAQAIKKIKDFGRLDDPPYGTRIGIETLIGDDHGGARGWGITVNALSGNEHKIPVFDFESQTVSLYDEGQLFGGEPIYTLPVDRFIEKYA